MHPKYIYSEENKMKIIFFFKFNYLNCLKEEEEEQQQDEQGELKNSKSDMFYYFMSITVCNAFHRAAEGVLRR